MFYSNQQRNRTQGISFPVIEMVIMSSLPATMSHVQSLIMFFKIDHDVIQNTTMPQVGHERMPVCYYQEVQ